MLIVCINHCQPYQCVYFHSEANFCTNAFIINNVYFYRILYQKTGALYLSHPPPSQSFYKHIQLSVISLR